MCYIVCPGGLARSDDFLAPKTAIFSDQDFKCYARDQPGLVKNPQINSLHNCAVFTAFDVCLQWC